jgi:hypothetical protein
MKSTEYSFSPRKDLSGLIKVGSYKVLSVKLRIPLLKPDIREVIYQIFQITLSSSFSR